MHVHHAARAVPQTPVYGESAVGEIPDLPLTEHAVELVRVDAHQIVIARFQPGREVVFHVGGRPVRRTESLLYRRDIDVLRPDGPRRRSRRLQVDLRARALVLLVLLRVSLAGRHMDDRHPGGASGLQDRRHGTRELRDAPADVLLALTNAALRALLAPLRSTGEADVPHVHQHQRHLVPRNLARTLGPAENAARGLLAETEIDRELPVVPERECERAGHRQGLRWERGGYANCDYLS